MTANSVRNRRKLYLDIALRRARPGTGSSIAFYRRREWSVLPVDLSNLRTPFAVIGAVAARLYMPERVTRDIDVLVHSTFATALQAELAMHGFRRHGELSIGGTTWQDDSGHEIDVIESGQVWVMEAIEQTVRSPDGLPVVRLPYLVLLKLNASRGQDVADLTRMLGLASTESLNEVRRIVRQYQPEDAGDLESLISLGELEFGPESR